MKIGQFVKRHVPAIFDYCETSDPSEFARLQDPQYSKETLDINFPFCKPVSKITPEEHVRFYNATYVVHRVPVRVTSQWFNPPTSKSLPLLRQYLAKREIAQDLSPQKEPTPPAANERAARGRYKNYAIGNAQNGFVRHLLGRLGDEQFNADQWQTVVSDFDQRCAYCGAKGDLVMEHVIPINRTALGEHRLGNLVPACRSCNATKAEQDYRVFLAHETDRIAAIEAHMAKHDYVPIGENQKLKQIIDLAHQDVRQLADRYAAIIDTLLADEDDKT
ncbi:HNH endonuclease signature motif containing protein [Marinovum sp. 2_MG-2023]|uniref:HNH endonuclease n=1 Tax=unclassified Marinovum TaxID=2647166 RepID=UPI0026E1AB3B|nr:MULTISPECIES: HNH endonuclease signature motif containing protein [unclassified Marinovum]MDO6731155.1 HNH endonuclease signature motif containing protein [Marinovum sp. 2_MG-2023]MDO6778652.1 HNH endonuclease signature motif containing protein [Marinovum sp. 1_MG-2023]